MKPFVQTRTNLQLVPAEDGGGFKFNELAGRVPCESADGTLLPGVIDSEFQPGASDRKVQAYRFRLCLTDVPENHAPFLKPAGYDPARYELLRRYPEKGGDLLESAAGLRAAGLQNADEVLGFHAAPLNSSAATMARNSSRRPCRTASGGGDSKRFLSDPAVHGRTPTAGAAKAGSGTRSSTVGPSPFCWKQKCWAKATSSTKTSIARIPAPPIKPPANMRREVRKLPPLRPSSIQPTPQNSHSNWLIDWGQATRGLLPKQHHQRRWRLQIQLHARWHDEPRDVCNRRQ